MSQKIFDEQEKRIVERYSGCTIQQIKNLINGLKENDKLLYVAPLINGHYIEIERGE